DLGVSGPFHHDVRGLDVAMNDLFAMERGESGQHLAHNGHRHPRLEARPGRAIGDNHAMDVLPSLPAHALACPLEHGRGKQDVEVVAIDPLHFENTYAIAFDEVLDVEQVVVLNLGDLATHLGH